MNKLILATSILLLSTSIIFAQQIGKPTTFKNILVGSSLSDTEIINGLKQALTAGAKLASQSLNKIDGYFGNPLVRIPFPPELTKMETTLRDIGLGKEVDKFILSMNRSAEDAAIEAAPIFTNAITTMSITDAKSILLGSDTAATSYLKKTTYSPLYSAFSPHIQKTLDKNFVAAQWANLAKAYNKIPTTRSKVDTDIIAFTTGKALQGLFTQVGQEEMKIRKDPAAQTTDLLKKVFGSLSK